MHNKVSSGCRQHISLSHCIAFLLHKAPSHATGLEPLCCFPSQWSPPGIKGSRESATVCVRPKIVESRVPGKW